MARTLPLSLLDLPAEVRLSIYYFLIPQGHRFCIHCYNSLQVFVKENQSDPCIEPFNVTGAALFRVHSTCYHEAAVLLYSRNIFSFCAAKSAALWFKAVGRRNAGLIRYLHIRFQRHSSRRSPYHSLRSFKEDRMSFNQIISQLSGIRSLTFDNIGPYFSTREWSIPHLSFAKRIEKQLPWLTKFSHCAVDAEERFLRFTTEDVERRVDVSASIV